MRQIVRSAILATLIATPCWAQFTPPPSPSYCPWPAWKLPDAQPGDMVVYTDPRGVEYTKPQIDSAYDQVCWQQDRPDTGSRGAWLLADFLERFGPPERYAYGPTPVEGLDLYRTRHGSHAPTLIYIHGGAWRAGTAAGSGSMAENFVQAGANLIALDFINVIQAGGNLNTMAEQVRAAVAWVYQNAKKKLKIDPHRIYVSGFSSGGHLCGVVITTNWAARGLPSDFIQGAICGSGMYDLYPVSLSARNLYVNFGLDDTINKLSPIRHIENIHFPVVVAHGTKETPEFQRQTVEFAAALEAAGKDVTLIVAPGYNHFEFNETFANPYGPLGRAALELMGLRRDAAPGKPPKNHDK